MKYFLLPLYVGLIIASNIAIGQQSKVDSLKNLLTTSQTDSTLVEILDNLTLELYKIGQNEETKKFAQNIIDLSSKDQYAKDPIWIKRKAYGLGMLGIIYSIEGKLRDAYRYHLEALELRKQVRDTAGIGSSLTNIGIVCFYLADYPKAISYYLQSLEIAESQKDSLGISDIYNNIGAAHEYLQEWDEALKNYQASLQLRLVLHDQHGMASCYNNIGNICDYQNKFQESLDNHFKALALFTELEDKIGMGRANDNIANTYSNMGDYKEELKYRKAAKDLFEETGNNLDLIGTFNSIGASLNEQKKFTQAITSYHQGLSLATEIGARDRIMDAYIGLADSYAGLREFEKAYDFHQKYSIMRDSLLTENKQKDIADMKEKYESDKKDAEIILLNKNAELARETHKRMTLVWTFIIAGCIILALMVFARYRFLHALQVEKIRNRISQDLHDDIGSTLSSISISSTAAALMKAERFEEINVMLQHIGQNARAAMENMSDIVWAINPSNNTFKNMIERLQIFGITILDARNIQLHLDIPEVLHSIKLSIEQRKNIYLILREAIHNVAKYSKATSCQVSAQAEKKRILLTVQDDGIGFEGVKRSLGGNGLINMRHRATELNAAFHIQSEINKGTAITLQFSYP